jgi:hypothetical protein
MGKWIAFLFVLSIVIVPGCGSGNDPSSSTEPPKHDHSTKLPDPPKKPGYKVVEFNNGRPLVVGVSYAGKISRKRIDMSKDSGCGKGGLTDDIVVSPERGLKNAVVYLEINEGKDFDPRSQPVLDQKG